MTPPTTTVPGPFSGLSVKLIMAITLVILLVEVAVFVPTIANYRASWLDDRLRIGGVAVRVFDTVPDVADLPVEITDPLLQSAGALAIVYRRAGQTDLITLEAVTMPTQAHTADMRDRNPLRLSADAIETLFLGGNRMMRIVGVPPGVGEAVVEVIMPEAPLRADMLTYSRNIAVLSLLIAGVTALVIYILAERVLIGPIRRLTSSVVAFKRNPENATLIISPDEMRADEIGILERALRDTQTELFTMLRQRRHLADLGLAVAKINHDLRNMLTSAQLLSDQVATLDDPKVQRLAPRLVNTLDKAIGFAQSVLDYGRQQAAPPRPVLVDVAGLGRDAAATAGLIGHDRIEFIVSLPDDFMVMIDPEHLSRILVNLFKNAREAIDSDTAEKDSRWVRLSGVQAENSLRLEVSDNGPGLPPRARENLFVAFEGSARAGGTGLGLAIVRELVEANGGKITLGAQAEGTVFVIEFPTQTSQLAAQ
ncbi:sensor histidine kinase [Pelagibacterium lentulum]|uniref:histidine kinase n=1 Tax=Pelagibacterium lentulum TaxID=2029865 RepID=A0A916R7X4_9HYPH|nr:HAMP domain-containing sensor histidine kinase [Pelagibacterium lentulum]GGA41185.1 histidine kinase [Pelagibacterium lentulum]